MPLLLVTPDLGDSVLEFLVAGALGHGLCLTTHRMQQLQRRIFRSSAWLGGITGLLCGLGPAFMPGGAASFSLSSAAFIGLTAGTLATCGWYLAVSILVFGWQYGLAVPFRSLHRVRSMWTRRQSRRLASSHSVQTPPPDEHPPSRQTECEAKERAERNRLANQKRRVDARFACQMHYDRLAVALRDQFSPARLQEYFDRYMGDGSSAGDIEDRAAQLKTMLDEMSGGGAGCSQKGLSLESVRQEFERRRQEILAAAFDEKTAAAMLASLARDEERAIREFGQS